jgi:DNA-binding transcriptional ArsR family regulator
MEKNRSSFESCSCTVIHQDIVDMVRDKILEDSTVEDLAEFFKVFGDDTRLKILYALSISEMCVCDIAALLGMTQSAISHQLKVLRQSRLIRYRREGKVVYYSLDDDHIRQVFEQGLQHVNE